MSKSQDSDSDIGLEEFKRFCKENLESMRKEVMEALAEIKESSHKTIKNATEIEITIENVVTYAQEALEEFNRRTN